MSHFSPQESNRSSAHIAPLQIVKSQESLATETTMGADVVDSEVLQSTQTAIARTINEMTPPPTPHRPIDFSMTHTAPEQRQHRLRSDSVQPYFHNFLRAFYPFRPTKTTSTTTVTLPLNEGDVILVHSIHTNGWADGTLLTTGARGWLPTNYCEAYDHAEMRNLLKALLHFWDLLRGDLSPTMECFTNPEYMRGIIAGVRCLLDDSQCLTREAPMVTENIRVRRGRKALLSELSALVRTAKRLQDETADNLDISVIEDTLYEITLKAFTVVTRAVRFLDMWYDANSMTGLVQLSTAGDEKEGKVIGHYESVDGIGGEGVIRNTGHQEVMAEQSLPWNLGNHGSLDTSNVPPTPPSDAILFGQALTMDMPAQIVTERHASSRLSNQIVPAKESKQERVHFFHGSSTPLHLSEKRTGMMQIQPEQTDEQQSTENESRAASPLSAFGSQKATVSSTAFNRLNESRSSWSSAHARNTRPQSFRQSQRHSATHRISASGHATVACSGNLASNRLGAAHDAFLSHQGAFIGRLHIQSRSMSELLLTTQQSVTACKDLLSVVEEVWERDQRRSDGLELAKDTMYHRITDLVQTTRDIFHATISREEGEDFILPDHDRELMSAATDCVKAAGECVAQTNFVLERIGDFEFEPFGLGIFDDMSDAREERPRLAVEPSAMTETVGSEAKPEATPPVMDNDASRAEDALYSPDSFAEHLPSTSPDLTEQFPRPPMASLTSALPAPRESITFALPSPPSHLMIDEEHRPTFELGSHIWRPDALRLPSSPTVTDFPTSTRVDLRSTRMDLTLSGALLMPLPPSPVESPISCTSASFSSADSGGDDSWSARHASGSTTGHGANHDILRNSETSVMSQASTRATTPDVAVSQDRSDPADHFRSLSLSASQTTLSDSCEDSEGLLEKTFAHELIYNRAGQITGGTLPALIERMTTHHSTPDSTFVSTFYLTFRLFTTPVLFAEALVDRFRSVGESSGMAGPVRLRVYNVFKGWMESHWRQDCDHTALEIIVPFARGELSSVLPAAGSRLTLLADKVSLAGGPLVPRLVSSIGKTNTSIGSYIAPDTPMPTPNISKSQMKALEVWKQHGTRLSILDFDPLELARQFTIKESQIFCSIMPEELLAMEWTKKSGSKAVHVRAMSTLSTDLATLVADTILHLEAKKRAAIIKQWVKIAKKSLQLNNYDSLMAIICALNSSTVLRLKRTWEMVSPKTKATLEELRGIVEVTRNYAVLRQRLQNHVPPCLPFVGTYLTDLTFIEAGNQQTRHLSGGSGSGAGDAGKAVINFDKHQKTAKVIGELQRFQIPYRLMPVPELQDWMEAEINRVRASEEASLQSYYRRSLLLEPRENATSSRPSLTESAHSSFSGTSLRTNFDFLPWTNRDKSVSSN